MTTKLVGLISLLLLATLGASALLMNHYQQQVMSELANTVSQVGRATLETFQLSLQSSASGEEAGTEKTPTEPRADLQRTMTVLVPPPGGESAGHVSAFAWSVADDRPEAAGAPVDLPDGVRIIHRDRSFALAPGADALREPRRVVVHLGDVAATRADDGLVLKIPTQFEETRARTANPGDGAATAVFKTMSMSIPTEHYARLFASLRNRSLAVFCVVFLVGMLLATSLATRFTRPVRQLDRALHRLSEGDLDATVRAQGTDEVGRLGRAFNEMALKLREHRGREREVRRRERLSALGLLAAGVAHDVRNPLHSINLTLLHMDDAARPTDPQAGREFERSLGIIREEIGRLNELVERFLKFARSEKQTPEPFHAQALLEETVRLVERDAGRRGVTLSVAAEDHLPGLVGDVAAVRSAVLNLILNAFEALPEGGSITLTARRRGAQVAIGVRDTGQGIAARDQERVFDVGYTTRETGHGLGLAMVHQVVVEDHGGTVSLESAEGHGTLVELCFPLPARQEAG